MRRAHPGRSAVTPEDVASALDMLASRVRRMSPPLARHPDLAGRGRGCLALRTGFSGL